MECKYRTDLETQLEEEICVTANGRSTESWWKCVIYQLNCNNGVPVRVRSLNSILQGKAIEFYVKENNMNRMLQYLGQNLNDRDSTIFKLSLKAHYKFLGSDFLNYYYFCYHNLWSSLNHYSNDVVTNKGKSRAVTLERIRLILIVIVNIVKKGLLVNLKASSLKLILRHFFEYLIQCEPFMFTVFSLVDDGSWLSNLTVSKRQTKETVFSVLNETKYLSFLTRNMISWLRSPSFPTKVFENNLIKFDFNGDSLFNDQLISFAKFQHSFNSFVNICKYSDAFQLFPIALNDDEDHKSLSELLEMIMKGVKLHQDFPKKLSEYLVLIIGDVFKNRSSLSAEVFDSILLNASDSWKPNIVYLISYFINHEESIDLFYNYLYCENTRVAIVQDTSRINAFLDTILTSMSVVLKFNEPSRLLAECLIKIFDNLHIMPTECSLFLTTNQNFLDQLIILPDEKREETELIKKCFLRFAAWVAMGSKVILDLFKENSINHSIIWVINDYEDYDSSWRTIVYLSSVDNSLVHRGRNRLMGAAIGALCENVLKIEVTEDVNKQAEDSFYAILFCLTHSLKGLKSLLDLDDSSSDCTLTENQESNDEPYLFEFWCQYALKNDCSNIHELEIVAIKSLYICVACSIECSLFLQSFFDLPDKLSTLLSKEETGDGEWMDEVTFFRKMIIRFYNCLPHDDEIFLVEENLSSSNDIESYNIKKFDSELIIFISISMPSWSNSSRGLPPFDLENYDGESCLLSYYLAHLTTEDTREECVSSSNDDIELLPEEINGIDYMCRYAEFHKLFDNIERIRPEFISFYKSYKKWNSSGKSHTEEYDSFVGVIFLMSRGQSKWALNNLKMLITLQNISLLWLKHPMGGSSLIWESLERLCYLEIPIITKCFKEAGIPMWTILYRWLHEFFLLALSWEEIQKILLFLLWHPPAFIIYLFTTILQSEESNILECSKNGRIHLLLFHKRFERYKVDRFITSMYALDSKYCTVLNTNILK